MDKSELMEQIKPIILEGFKKANCKKPYTEEPYPYFDSQIASIAELVIGAGYRKADDVRKESISDFAKILMSLFFEDYKDEKIRRVDVRDCIKTVAEAQYGVKMEIDE